MDGLMDWWLNKWTDELTIARTDEMVMVLLMVDEWLDVRLAGWING